MSNRAEKYAELITELRSIGEWCFGRDNIDFGETMHWAANEFEKLAQEAAKAAVPPRDCLCGAKPVILEHLEQDNFMISCPQAFLRAEADAPACKKPVIMRAIGRAEAVASWNDLIRKYEGEFVGQL